MFVYNYFQVSDPDSNDFLGAIALYEQSFPPSEKLPTATIKDKIKKNIFQLWIQKDQEKIILMAILCPLPETDFTLLGYLATAPEYRGKGLGKEFMAFIKKTLQKENQWLLLEVENPLFPPDQEIKQRRVDFYLRLGAKIIKDVSYLLPDLSEQTSPEMILMIYPDYQKEMLTPLLIKKLIQLTYEYFYDQPSHKNLNILTNKLPNKIELTEN
ncbi:MAG: GNAT family N-acetyltransferase [Cyanobacterium sp.]